MNLLMLQIKNPVLTASFRFFFKLDLRSDPALQYYWRPGSELKSSFLKKLYEVVKTGFLIWDFNLQLALSVLELFDDSGASIQGVATQNLQNITTLGP